MIKTFPLKYGDSYQSVTIDTNLYQIDLIEPHFSPAPASSIEQLVEEQLSNPLGTFDWSTISPTTFPRIAISINDKTRPVPHDHLLPPLLKYLSNKGYPREQIRFYIATGTHTPMPKEEFTKILPHSIIEQYTVVSHDCDDQTNLQYLGKTSANTPVWVNQAFYQADIKLVIGNIEPHHFMGFSGGNKSASIGLAGRETINKNHAMIRSPFATVGMYAENPMRQDIEEIGDLIGVSAALNVIMNTKREIVHVLFGSPIEVMHRGVTLCKKVYETDVPNKYDIVISSVGGYPKDINFYQAQKAMTHSALISKEQGTVILCAECREGSGSLSFEKFVAQTSSYQEALALFLEHPFQIGPHKAYQVGKLLEKINFCLISDMPPALAKKLHFQANNNLQQAFDAVAEKYPSSAKIAIMPNAINTIPVNRE